MGQMNGTNDGTTEEFTEKRKIEVTNTFFDQLFFDFRKVKDDDLIGRLVDIDRSMRSWDSGAYGESEIN